MNRNRMLILVAMLGVMTTHNGLADERGESQTQRILTWKMTDLDGRSQPLVPDQGQALTVVCFLGVDCPLARLYAPRLSRLAAEFPEVRILGVNSNRQDALDEVSRFVKEHQLTFPLIKDRDARLADLLEASRTPEVFVIDALGVVRYRGRIDDQYVPGISKREPGRHDLQEALTELLAGRPVTVAQTTPTGCLIGRGPRGTQPTSMTYTREISRVLQRHCVECHREGDIGPFALTEYEEILGWGEMILEVVSDGRMPPWHAAPDHGSFLNAREMSCEDQQMLRDWVAGGMPFGDPADLPEPLPANAGWRLAETPDHVVPMSGEPFAVPADGVVDYQYFVVDPGFAEDVWVHGAEVRPGARSVVHHCIVFIRPPDGKNLSGAGFLSAYVPGQRATTFPPGYARRVPAGSRLVFQMHYTPNGTPQQDLTEIGLSLLPSAEVTHEVTTVVGINRDFEIPPHAVSFPVDGVTEDFDPSGELLAITPHMHFRGKGVTVTAWRGDSSEVLLDVPRYDFNWQHVYELSERIPLNTIDRLAFQCRFDNSTGNHSNPDPAIHVTWGEQSWEEMAIVFFEVARPRGSAGVSRRSMTVAGRDAELNRRQQAAEFAAQFIRKFDRNGDGLIVRDELPASLKRFGFERLDRDGDGKLTLEEIEQLATQEF